MRKPGVKKMKQIISEFFDSSIRVEKVIHIGTMCMDSAWPDIARKAFEYDPTDVWAALGLQEPEIEDSDEWGEVLREGRKLGYLIQFATPIPDDFYDGGYSFSWGWYTTHWIYDDSFESACAKALKWQDEFIERRRAKAEENQPLKCRDKNEVDHGHATK